MYDDTDLLENPPVYNRGDIVWVKLSGFWWPAEVKNREDMPDDLLSQFKKPPLVIVKFFDEDSYEFIKNWSQIYPYNCDKKNDFIKKGMTAFRSKAVHMSKFPKDIGTAEEKTDGNPNILSLPEFLPVKKINYEEIFGPSPNKKSPKSKMSSISKKTSNKSSAEPIITHRRFLGKNDFKAYIMLQYPGKDRLCSSDDEEIKKLNEEPKNEIQCSSCLFKTKRIGVMIWHTQMHSKGERQQSPTKRKPTKSKEVVRSDSESDSDVVEPTKPKQRRKRQPKSKAPTTFSDILNEWDDSEADDKADTKESTSKSEEESKIAKTKANTNEESASSSPTPVKNTQDDIKNCFDFDEEDEDEDVVLPASTGRKIPRVIPEKHKPSISELLERDKESEKPEKLCEVEPEISEDTHKETSAVNADEEPTKNPSENDDTIEKAFKELMEETSVPKIDDIDSKLKPEQNFHDASTIKFPDKGGTKESASKRKFITSFEDFEAGFRKLESENNRKMTENSLQTTEEKPVDVQKLARRRTRGQEDVKTEDLAVGSKKKLGNRRNKEGSKELVTENPKEVFDFDREEPNIKLMQAEFEEKSEESLRSRKSRNKKHAEETIESESSPKLEETLEDNTSMPEADNSLENTTKSRRRSRWNKTQKIAPEEADFDGPVTAEISIENLRNSVSKKLDSTPIKSRKGRNKKEQKETSVLHKQPDIPKDEEPMVNEQFDIQKDDLKKEDAAVENIEEQRKNDQKIDDTVSEIEENQSEVVPEPEEVHETRRGRSRQSHIENKDLAPVNNEHASSMDEPNSVPSITEIEPEMNVEETSDKPSVSDSETLPLELPTTEIVRAENENSETVTEPQETTEDVPELDQKLKVRRGRSKKRDSTHEDAVTSETPVAVEDTLEEQEIVSVEPSSTEIVQTEKEDLENVADSQTTPEEVQESDRQKIKGKRGRPRKRDSTPKPETDETVALETPLAVEEGLKEEETVSVEPPSTETVQTEKEDLENIAETQTTPEEVLESDRQKIKGKRGRPRKRDSTPKPETDDTVSLEIPLAVEESLEEQKPVLVEPSSTEIDQTQQEISKLQEPDQQQIKGSGGRSRIRDGTPKPDTEDNVLLEIPPAVEESVKEQNEEIDEGVDIIETPAPIPELDLAQDEIVLPSGPECVEESVSLTDSRFKTTDTKESDVGSSDNDCALSIDEKLESANNSEKVRPKKGRGRPRKHSLIDNPEESEAQSKGVPPKKNRWSRRSSQDSKGIPEYDLPQEEVVPAEPEVVEEEVNDTKECDAVSSDNDGALSIDEKPKKGRGRPRKQSHIETQEEAEVQSKSVPPKKNKWSRRTSQNRNEVQSEETEKIEEETVENKLEKLNEEKSLDELILPLKKSKRVNDMTALMQEERKKNSIEFFENVPGSNALPEDDVAEEKKGEVTEANDIFKCVPPKKKKIEPIDLQDTKEEDSVPQPPKKKIQKLFETAQALEKNDMLMSPLAKKKSFLFNQAEVKTLEENYISTKLGGVVEVEVPKSIEDRAEKPQTEEVDVDGFFNLPKKKEEDKPENVQKDVEDSKNSEDNILIPVDIPVLPESELVPIEGTLTVMSEKDLVDAQVEITPDQVISEKKPMTLDTFSMDFDQVLSPNKETPPKDKDPLKPNAYQHKSELLDILEGNNSDSGCSDSKTKPEQQVKRKSVVGMFDFEDAIPSQIVLANKATAGGDHVILESPKLLERLSMSSEQSKKINIQSDIKIGGNATKPAVVNKAAKAVVTPKPGPKIIIKAAKPSVKSGSKPIILSEQIIRPANKVTPSKAAIQGVKRQFEDVEDVETAFVIPKIAKKSVEKEVIAVTPEKGHKTKAATSKSNVKAKILQQTIITPKGEIIQPQQTSTTNTTIHQSTQPLVDDTVFDINSMPIVLSDDLLTPESIQNMPVVLTEQVQAKVLPEKPPTPSFIKKVVTNVTPKQQIIFKTTQPGLGTPLANKQATKPRILSGTTPATKVTRPQPAALLATGTSIDGKPTKYVFVPSSMTSTIPQGKTIKTVARKQQGTVPTKQNVQTTELVGQQPVGNKIMIVTNQHGQQHRVVLTPQQQKVLMQAQSGTKVTKTIIKGGIAKSLVESPSAGSSGIPSKPTASNPNVSSSSTILNHGLLMPASKSSKSAPPVQGKKPVQKGKPQKTILIKNQLGQTVRKIQGTDDAELDRQVAEQLEAIKASARQQQANKTPEILNFANRSVPTAKTAPRRPYMKKPPDVIVKKPMCKPLETAVPALTPLSPPPKPSPAPQTVAKSSTETLPQVATSNRAESKPTKSAEVKPERPLNQLVIQDALGNQTTITEGQILALPSETVDGQPQSYMLVTLDETGNLTPLNNEALMSLDPSLGLGGDINNVVLQVDQGQGIVAAVKPANAETSSSVAPKKADEKPKVEPRKTVVVQEGVAKAVEAVPEQPKQLTEACMTVGAGEALHPSPEAALGGQQLIVTGDPIATQKFLESLSDGTTDLANILAGAEGGSVIIQADGQQILIKTNAGADAQAMLGLAENPESAGNPVFASHKPNQDILAAALAGTDVFQPQASPIKSQLSPGGGAAATPLYPPMHVGNVLETCSLTLGSPIMTPLEVPSTNSKKIDDESEILNQVVPKNVDLPITITDPNISQTVAQQRQNAAGLMELTLPIPENVVGASEINSPTSYGFVLPSLDEAVGMATSQKTFGSSMPLLTEDVLTEGESNGSIEKDSLLGEKASNSDQNSFESLPLLQETIQTSKEDEIKCSSFGSISSMPMLTDDVVEDSTSSVESNKPSRPSPKHRGRDIANEGLCTLGGEMCSSLSEPPPDMFDLGPLTAAPPPLKEEEVSSDRSSIPEDATTTTTSVSSPNSSETSGEIPIQPPIVATLNDLKRPGTDSDDGEEQAQAEKRPKFDCK